MKTCFMFGHRDTPETILPQIERAVEHSYCERGIREFVVGSRGNFDQLAAQAVRAVKKRRPDIRLTLLLAYPPASSAESYLRGYDSVFYPEGMEYVDRKYAIVQANRYMVEHADSILCLVNHAGNTAALLHAARQRNIKDNVPIENLAL